MIELSQVKKSWHLGIEDIFGEYYWDGDAWVILTDEIEYDDRWIEETLHKCAASDLIQNLIQYLPGAGDACDYGDFWIEFDLNDVEEAGWTEDELTSALQAIADLINSGCEIYADDEPFQYESTDSWGSKYTYWRYPALLPVANEKYLEIEYPTELTP